MESLAALTDYSIMDAENIMDIKTEKISPINSSSGGFRHTFRLDTASYLDENTLLTFKAKAAAAKSDALRFNCFNGCLGAIKRVVFRVGDYEIQNLEDAGMWSTLNVLMTESPDKQAKFWAHYFQNSLQFEVSPEVEADRGVNGSHQVGQVQVDYVRSGIEFGAAADAAGIGINSAKINSDSDENFLCAVPLGVVCPAIKGRQLPLFLFQDYRVVIEVEFERDASKYANWIGGTIADNLAASAGDITFTDVEMLVDYLIFPSAVQEAIRERTRKDGGYQLDFLNVVNMKKTIPAAQANTNQRVEHRLATQDQEVHYVQQLKRFTGAAASGADKVLLGQRADCSSIETIQYNVNGVDMYPQPYFSPLSQYNQLSETLGKDLQTVKPLYCGDVNTQYSQLSCVESGLQGKYKPLGVSMRNGTPSIRFGGTGVGSYPMIVKYERRPHGEIQPGGGAAAKIALAETAAMDVDYFVAMTRVAVIKETPSGMLVNVVN